MFLFFSFFFPARSFSGVGHLACLRGAGHDRFFLLFSSRIFLFLIRLLCFCFLFGCYVAFAFSISYNVYVVPVVSSILTWHFIAHCCAYSNVIRGNVVFQRCRFVTTELASLLRLRNRHGPWLCWMSTGRKNGLMGRTHIYTGNDF